MTTSAKNGRSRRARRLDSVIGCCSAKNSLRRTSRGANSAESVDMSSCGGTVCAAGGLEHERRDDGENQAVHVYASTLGVV